MQLSGRYQQLRCANLAKKKGGNIMAIMAIVANTVRIHGAVKSFQCGGG